MHSFTADNFLAFFLYQDTLTATTPTDVMKLESLCIKFTEFKTFRQDES